jgi:hypothetical protein
VFGFAFELGTTVEALLENISARELLQWMAFFAVREEKAAEARRDAAAGFKDGDEEIRY